MKALQELGLYFYRHRIVRFLFSGGLAVATNLVVLFVLVHFFHIWYLTSSVVSFSSAVLVSFVMQKFFTFNDYGREKMHHQALYYLAFQIFNLTLNTFLIYVSVGILHQHYLLSQIVIAALMTVYNFFVYKHLVFTPDTAHHKSQ